MAMIVNIAMNEDEGYLHAAVRGEFSLEEAQQTFLAILQRVVQEGAHRVLFEGVDVTGEPTTIQRFYYAKFAAAAVCVSPNEQASAAARFAYVLRPPVLDPRRFGENVAVNRGMNVRAFEDLAAARRWLGL